MVITSTAFMDGGKIPHEFSRYGANKIPPLKFEDVPEDAVSLVLIIDDPDAPGGTFTHWLLYNIDPDIEEIEEDALPVPACQGINDFGEIAYGGPRPPSGEHQYFFRAYALDTALPLKNGVSRETLEEAMDDHILEKAELMGRYAFKDSTAAAIKSPA